MPLELRPLQLDDRAAIEALLRADGSFTEEEVSVALELLVEPGYEFVVATDGDQIAGYACHGRAWFSDGAWELYWLAVGLAYRRRGVGSTLVAAVETAATGARFVLVETAGRPDYEPVRAFYERCGYSEVARVPDFYRVGDDKVVYRKLL